MSSLFSSISKLVSGGPALNYTLADEPYGTAWGCWTHFPGTSKEDGSSASVFKLTAADPNDLKLAAARNGVKRLKMVRSSAAAAEANTPALLSCMHPERSSSPHPESHLITERAHQRGSMVSFLNLPPVNTWLCTCMAPMHLNACCMRV